MAIRINIDDSQVESLFARLGKLNHVKANIKAAAIHLKGKIADYPPRRSVSRISVYGRSFESPAQRRAVFAKIANGEIPYRRGISGQSETLGRSWSIETVGLNAHIQTSASYAPLVQGKRQSKMMRVIGWKKAEDIAKKESGVIKKMIRKGLEKEF